MYKPTATSYRPGSLTLPREYYLLPEIFAEEIERLFARQWTCVV